MQILDIHFSKGSEVLPRGFRSVNLISLTFRPRGTEVADLFFIHIEISV